MVDAVHWFNMGPFPVFVGFTDSPAAFARCMKRMKIKNPPQMLAHERASATMHSFTGDGSLTCIITLGDHAKRPKAQIAAMLAHEALHVVQAMRDELNRRYTFDDETESYLVQMITQRCLEKLWRNAGD